MGWGFYCQPCLEANQEGGIGAEADKLLLDGKHLADVVLPVAHLGELLAQQLGISAAARLDVEGGLDQPLADGVQLGDEGLGNAQRLFQHLSRLGHLVKERKEGKVRKDR